MLRQIFILFCLAYSVQSGTWHEVGYTCVSAKGSGYGKVTYTGEASFIGAVKLVHTGGLIGCGPTQRSNWGCIGNHVRLNMYVTDTHDQIIYPAPRLVSGDYCGFYKLPGFNSSSPELVLSDFGNPSYLKPHDELRIWYGEDLLGNTEDNNQGRTCMSVYVHKLSEPVNDMLFTL